MLFMHPVLQSIAFLAAFICSIIAKGRRGLRFNLIGLLPLLLFMAALNPLFNHQGVTLLFYLESGNPVTLESILYGLSTAVMFVTVILWFSCYNQVMTSDKFIYLFGRILPAFSLLLSMALRFVPRYMAKIREISFAQKGIGRDVTQGSWIRRMKRGMKILSIMTTWALENAIETADSMKSRGYGLPGRTSFAIFRFDRRDWRVLLVLTILIALVLMGALLGENSIRFFPSIRTPDRSLLSYIVYAAYFALCSLPVVMTIQEGIHWKRID
ncbi:energy-coupling factor transporter transmembrane protein EcfT [Paenibacillus sp. PAMC21692]|nr:energy-coupling factor transporter transmembrane protein EcfT [Paenibacillus sp. PAMC21692]